MLGKKSKVTKATNMAIFFLVLGRPIYFARPKKGKGCWSFGKPYLEVIFLFKKPKTLIS